jgi:hypothetical protein
VDVVNHQDPRNSGEDYSPEWVAENIWRIVNHNCNLAGAAGGQCPSGAIGAVTELAGRLNDCLGSIGVDSFVTI